MRGRSDFVKDRIKEVRKTLKLTQTDFGRALGVSLSAVQKWESGENVLSDAVILLIAQQYGISETWLRTGGGEMFRTSTPDQQIAEFAGRLLEGRAEDAFKRKLVSALSRIPPESWAALEQIADAIAEEEKK
jgi:transcriptional regulator with XRE-family HTH domain